MVYVKVLISLHIGKDHSPLVDSRNYLNENGPVSKYELKACTQTELNISVHIRMVGSDVTCLYKTTELWP